MFVRLWMTEKPITIITTQSVATAKTVMEENGIRRLPVVDHEGQLKGIVSVKDVFNALPSIVDGSSAGSGSTFSEETTVAEIMTADPMSVGLMTPLETVAKRMRQHKVGSMPVLDDGELIGIITESDIFRAFMEVLGGNEDGIRVEMIMSQKSEDFYDILNILKRYGMIVVALTIHNNFGKNQRLLTLKLKGEEFDTTLTALRKFGVQVNFIEGVADSF